MNEYSLYLYRIVRMTLGLIFLWSGVVKLADPVSFGKVINAYGIIPEGFSLFMGFALSILEIVGGAGLLMNIKGSLSIISGLLILFIIVLGYGIWMGFDMDCGCFGPEDPESSAFHGLKSALFRDLGMLAGVVYLYLQRFMRSCNP